MRELYKKRAKQLFYAYLGLLTLIFLASLVLYPFFKLPLPSKLIIYSVGFVFFFALFSIPLALYLRKKLFPVEMSKDPYWSYTATRRYFWLFVLVSLPFFIAFLIYLIFASLLLLFLGYTLSLVGLLLVKPKEEDVI